MGRTETRLERGCVRRRIERLIQRIATGLQVVGARLYWWSVRREYGVRRGCEAAQIVSDDGEMCTPEMHGALMDVANGVRFISSDDFPNR